MLVMEVPASRVLVHSIKLEELFRQYKGPEVEACLTCSRMGLEAYVSGVEGTKRQIGFMRPNCVRL